MAIVQTSASPGSPAGLTGATGATRYVGGTADGPPTSGTFAVGDFVIDRQGTVWICTTAGSPGTWDNPYTPNYYAKRRFGLLDWTQDLRTCSSRSVMTGGTLYANSIPLFAGVSYSLVYLAVSIAGTGTAPTSFFVGICDDVGNVLASSNDLHASTGLTTTGVQAFPMTNNAPYTPAQTVSGYAFALEVGAFGTTAVQFAHSPFTSSNIATDGTNYLTCVGGTGLAAVPAAITMSVTSALAFWFGVS